MFRCLLLPLILLLPLLSSSRAEVIKDTAGMFSEKALNAAQHDLDDLQSATGVDVIIETFPQASQTKFRSDRDKEKFFQEWLMRLAKDREATGVIVLICKTPGRVQVDFHKNLLARGIPLSARSKVRDAALAKLKAKDNDGALQAIADTLAKVLNDPVAKTEVAKPQPDPISIKPKFAPVAPVAPPVEQGWGWGIWFLIIGLIVISALVVFACIAVGAQSDSRENWFTPLGSQSWRKGLAEEECHKCAGHTRGFPCEYCGAAESEAQRLRREEKNERFRQAYQPPPASGPTIIHNHPDTGGNGLVTGMVLGQMMSQPHRTEERRHDPPPSYTPPAYDPPAADYSPPSSSSYDSGSSGFGSDSGGGFDGGSGGDF